MPTDLTLATTMVDGGPAHVRWRTAMNAIAQKDFAGARQHLAAALEFHPAAAQLLLDLALACDDDPDLAALWTERFVRAAADDKGKLKLDAPTRKRTAASAPFSAELPAAQELTAARTAALVELARFVQKQKPKAKQNATRALLVRWASELLLAAGDGAPAALQAVAAEVAATQAAFEPDYETV